MQDCRPLSFLMCRAKEDNRYQTLRSVSRQTMHFHGQSLACPVGHDFQPADHKHGSRTCQNSVCKSKEKMEHSGLKLGISMDGIETPAPQNGIKNGHCSSAIRILWAPQEELTGRNGHSHQDPICTVAERICGRRHLAGHKNSKSRSTKRFALKTEDGLSALTPASKRRKIDDDDTDENSQEAVTWAKGQELEPFSCSLSPALPLKDDQRQADSMEVNDGYGSPPSTDLTSQITRAVGTKAEKRSGHFSGSAVASTPHGASVSSDPKTKSLDSTTHDLTIGLPDTVVSQLEKQFMEAGKDGNDLEYYKEGLERSIQDFLTQSLDIVDTEPLGEPVVTSAISGPAIEGDEQIHSENRLFATGEKSNSSHSSLEQSKLKSQYAFDMSREPSVVSSTGHKDKRGRFSFDTSQRDKRQLSSERVSKIIRLEEQPGQIVPKSQNLELSRLDIQNDGGLMLDTSQGFLIYLDRQLRILFVSENVSQHLGHQQPNMMGENIKDYIHRKDLHEFLKQTGETQFITGKENSVPTWMTRRMFYIGMKFCFQKPGSRSKESGYTLVQWNVNLRLRKSSDGQNVKVKGIVALCRPVRTDSVLEMRMDGNMFISRHNLSFQFIYCDPRIVNLLGYEPSELLGRTGYHFHSPLDVLICRQCIKHLMSTGSSTSGYYRFLSRTGAWIWLFTQATIVYDTVRNPQYIVCRNHVISPREAESKLLKERRDFDSMKCLGFSLETDFPVVDPVKTSHRTVATYQQSDIDTESLLAELLGPEPADISDNPYAKALKQRQPLALPYHGQDISEPSAYSPSGVVEESPQVTNSTPADGSLWDSNLFTSSQLDLDSATPSSNIFGIDLIESFDMAIEPDQEQSSTPLIPLSSVFHQQQNDQLTQGMSGERHETTGKPKLLYEPQLLGNTDDSYYSPNPAISTQNSQSVVSGGQNKTNITLSSLLGSELDTKKSSAAPTPYVIKDQTSGIEMSDKTANVSVLRKVMFNNDPEFLYDKNTRDSAVSKPDTQNSQSSMLLSNLLSSVSTPQENGRNFLDGLDKKRESEKGTKSTESVFPCNVQDVSSILTNGNSDPFLNDLTTPLNFLPDLDFMDEDFTPKTSFVTSSHISTLASTFPQSHNQARPTASVIGHQDQPVSHATSSLMDSNPLSSIVESSFPQSTMGELDSFLNSIPTSPSLMTSLNESLNSQPIPFTEHLDVMTMRASDSQASSGSNESLSSDGETSGKPSLLRTLLDKEGETIQGPMTYTEWILEEALKKNAEMKKSKVTNNTGGSRHIGHKKSRLSKNSIRKSTELPLPRSPSGGVLRYGKDGLQPRKPTKELPLPPSAMTAAASPRLTGIPVNKGTFQTNSKHVEETKGTIMDVQDVSSEEFSLPDDLLDLAVEYCESLGVDQAEALMSDLNDSSLWEENLYSLVASPAQAKVNTNSSHVTLNSSSLSSSAAQPSVMQTACSKLDRTSTLPSLSNNPLVNSGKAFGGHISTPPTWPGGTGPCLKVTETQMLDTPTTLRSKIRADFTQPLIGPSSPATGSGKMSLLRAAVTSPDVDKLIEQIPLGNVRNFQASPPGRISQPVGDDPDIVITKVTGLQKSTSESGSQMPHGRVFKVPNINVMRSSGKLSPSKPLYSPNNPMNSSDHTDTVPLDNTNLPNLATSPYAGGMQSPSPPSLSPKSNRKVLGSNPSSPKVNSTKPLPRIVYSNQLPQNVNRQRSKSGSISPKSTGSAHSDVSSTEPVSVMIMRKENHRSRRSKSVAIQTENAPGEVYPEFERSPSDVILYPSVSISSHPPSVSPRSDLSPASTSTSSPPTMSELEKFLRGYSGSEDSMSSADEESRSRSDTPFLQKLLTGELSRDKYQRLDQQLLERERKNSFSSGSEHEHENNS